jgi:hypothetical protein
MSGRAKTKVGRDSVEPTHERSEASLASISLSAGRPPKSRPSQEARLARAAAGGKQGSTESRPTVTA